MEPSVRGAKSVVVVGGGLIGLSTGLLLAERGAQVTIIDSGELGSGAARGNAGFMCTTLLEPLAAPGAMRSALGSLRDPLRPLRVHPRALPGMARWGLHFARSTTKRRYVAGRTALARLNQRSAEGIDRLAALGVELEPGPTLVVPFKDPSVAAHHLSTLAPMADFGVAVPETLLDGDELRRVVPALSDAINAGYILDGDHSIDPRVFVDSMIAALRKRGVTLVEHSSITSVCGEGRSPASSVSVPRWYPGRATTSGSRPPMGSPTQ